MSAPQFPLARKDGLTVKSLNDELLVYDNRTKKMYALSPTATTLWQACDGKRTVRELVERLNRQSPTTEQVVWYGLGQLNELLEEPVVLPNELAGVSRRHFLKMSGVVAAGVTLPLVVKLVAPSPAAAQSGGLLCCRCNDNPPPGFIVGNCAACAVECGPIFSCGSCIS